MEEGKTVDINWLCKIVRPGDGCLTVNPNGLGKAINFFQKIGGGDDSEYGHVLFFIYDESKPGAFTSNGLFAESNAKIRTGHIEEYVGKKICVFRNRQMTEKLYFHAMPEMKDNIGQIYPAYRLLLICADSIRAYFYRKILRRKPFFRWAALHVDWPVCSEYYAQFLVSAPVETGLLVGEGKWAGIVPDDFDDVRQKRLDLYRTLARGVLTA